MKCKDCKGSGAYLGLGRQEVCARCQGSCVEPEGREVLVSWGDRQIVKAILDDSLHEMVGKKLGGPRPPVITVTLPTLASDSEPPDAIGWYQPSPVPPWLTSLLEESEEDRLRREARDSKPPGEHYNCRCWAPPTPSNELAWSRAHAEAVRRNQQAQLAVLRLIPQDQLADAIRELPDPLPQVVFEAPESFSDCGITAPTDGWFCRHVCSGGWYTGHLWFLWGVCATPGPEPAPDAPVLRIETVEALEALVERYRYA